MTRGLATLESRGVIEKATAHPTLPIYIYIIVVRKECDINVGHLYKWALTVVER